MVLSSETLVTPSNNDAEKYVIAPNIIKLIRLENFIKVESE